MSGRATTTRLARLRVLATAMLSAVALAAPAAPAAAAMKPHPWLAIVNGMPGTTVEVCIGGREVRSTLGYARWFTPTVAPGNRVVRFRVASTGTCTGAVLGRERLVLDEDDDLTLVGTRQPDRVVVFDDTPQPRDRDTSWWLAFRNAGDIGKVAYATETQGIRSPSLPDAFAKGDSIALIRSANATFDFGVTRLGRSTPTVEGRFGILAGLRGEAIVVGDTADTARVVYLVRDKNGKPGLKGTCPICGGKVFKGTR